MPSVRPNISFDEYMKQVCLRLGFRESIEEFREPIQFYWDTNLSIGYAVRLMREVVGIERVH